MIEDTISQLERRLQNEGKLTAEQKLELTTLINQLRAEVAEARRHRPAPTSVRATNHEENEDSPLTKLSESVTEFETTHPQLVGLVNRISTILANMGI